MQGLGAGVGEASGSGTTATGTNSSTRGCGPRPRVSHRLGGRQYGPGASLKFPACSLLPPQRPSLFFLHPSLALWAARPGP